MSLNIEHTSCSRYNVIGIHDRSSAESTIREFDGNLHANQEYFELNSFSIFQIIRNQW